MIQLLSRVETTMIMNANQTGTFVNVTKRESEDNVDLT